MRILILGATGRTGKHILEQTLHKGYIVHVLVRDRSKIHLVHNQLHIFEGSPADITAIEKAMKDCEAVLSALNISRTSDFPWAGLRTPKDFLSDTMNKIIAVCNKLGCKRIIVTTAWGVNESKKEIPGWFRWFIENSNIKYPYRDHGLLEELLKASSLDWTIIRPAGLINSSKEKKVKVSFNGLPKPGLTISRRNVARFMVAALEEHAYIKELPTIST
ncbi:hypothetical protein CAP36_00475 [Chitinophagaceae bacterium IBVUCB2]|nr:hypothetical protein CAP36_00475 [Chitinophagaceae bacterium IBVUCB2]